MNSKNLTLDQCMAITGRFGESVGIPEYGQQVRGRIETFKSFLFTGHRCFIVLTPVDDNGLCVHVDIAFSESGVNFNAALNWVLKKAHEIGAVQVTFCTKNDKLERIARRRQWLYCGEVNGFSKWKIDARQSNG